MHKSEAEFIDYIGYINSLVEKDWVQYQNGTWHLTSFGEEVLENVLEDEEAGNRTLSQLPNLLDSINARHSSSL